MFVQLLLSEENEKCWKKSTSLSSAMIEDVWTYRTGRSKTALGLFLFGGFLFFFLLVSPMCGYI